MVLPINKKCCRNIEMEANIQFKVQIMIQKLYNYIAQCLWHRNTKCVIFEHATFMMENESSNCNITFFLMVTKYSYAILTARTSVLNGDKIMLREWQQQHTLFLNLIQSEENYFFSECRKYLIDTKKLCYVLLLKSILLYNPYLKYSMHEYQRSICSYSTDIIIDKFVAPFVWTNSFMIAMM